MKKPRENVNVNTNGQNGKYKPYLLRGNDEKPSEWKSWPLAKQLAWENIYRGYWWLMSNYAEGYKADTARIERDGEKSDSELSATEFSKLREARTSVEYVKKLIWNRIEITMLLYIAITTEIFGTVSVLKPNEERRLVGLIKTCDKDWLMEQCRKRVDTDEQEAYRFVIGAEPPVRTERDADRERVPVRLGTGSKEKEYKIDERDFLTEDYNDDYEKYGKEIKIDELSEAEIEDIFALDDDPLLRDD